METLPVEFEPFPKIARLTRECVITEKIDGTNAQIHISDAGEIQAGSRNGWIQPGKQDNYGFAGWVEAHRESLLNLGPGRHFGEWWGLGINRNYGLKEKVFSLFNTSRWSENLPDCCRVVPLLYQGIFSTDAVSEALAELQRDGSHAAPGFINPEGVVVFHVASGQLFKKTLVKDELWKGSPTTDSPARPIAR